MPITRGRKPVTLGRRLLTHRAHVGKLKIEVVSAEVSGAAGREPLPPSLIRPHA